MNEDADVRAPLSSITLWHEGREVASLERSGDDLTSLRLRYHEDWVAGRNSFPLSTRFPLSRQIHDGEAIYFWLMNLLPEDDALKTVGHILDVSDIDVLGLVAAMGGDLPGAVTARATGTPFMPGRPRIKVWTGAELARDIRRLPQRPLLIGDDGVQMSLAGQQAKLPVVRMDDGALALPLDGHPSTHILKPQARDLRASVENEAYCMRLARRCGLNAAEVEIRQAEDLRYLLVKRYDRRVSSGKIARLHQEDLCQALGFAPYRKYEWNARVRMQGPTAADLFQAVSDGPFRARNRLALLDAFVFNVLVCNVDSHAKNYSLLLPSSVPELAPIYDVMCGRVYEGITENLPQKIAGKQRGDHIYGRHWTRMANELHLGAAATRRRVSALAARVLQECDPLANETREETPASGIVDEISTVIQARCRRVLANLSDADVADEVAEDDEGEPMP